MKRSERHHLKEDQLAATLAETYAKIDENRRTIALVATAAVVAVVAAGGFYLWRAQTNTKAASLLGEALVVAEAPVVPPTPAVAGQPALPPTPGSYPSERVKLEAALPKFMAAADAYPSTTAGIAARFHAATALVALGKDQEALLRYQEVVSRDSGGLYNRMARLGIAELQVRAKKYDEAIATYKDLATSAKDDLPVDAILMQLGKTCRLAGKRAEARQAFERVRTEFATSPYAADAGRELDQM
jgi:hypothetical protein